MRRKTLQNKGSARDGVEDRPKTTPHLPPGKGLAKNKAEAASYIAEMLPVLCNMANDVELKFLNYLLEMAFEEALHCSKEMSKSDSSQKSCGG